MATEALTAARQRRITACLTLISFSVLFVTLLYLLALVAPQPPPLNVPWLQQTFIVSPDAFRPEQVERLLFVGGTVCAPLLVLLLYRLQLPLVRAMKPRVLAILDPALLLGVSAATIGITMYSYRRFDCRFGSPHFSEMTAAIGALAGAVSITWLITGSNQEGARARWARRLDLAVHYLAIGLIILCFLLSIFNLDAVTIDWCFTVSFNAVFHAISQVFNGKELLVDLSHQYGLYPHFLVPFFRLTGLSVLGFTVAMGAMTAATYGCIYWLLRRTVVSRLIAALCCSSMLFFNYLFMRIASKEYYFQFHPLRTIFPALSLVLTYRYFQGRSRGIYYLSFVLYAISMLWNFETGFVVFAAWLLVLCYDELPTRTIRPLLAHLGRGLAVCAATFTTFTLVMLVAYGKIPDYAIFFRFHQIFYGLGYRMLPMPLVGFWILVILFYVVALIASAEALVTGTHTLISRMLFFVAVLGVGVFSYYQGRSCGPVLLGAFYPATIVLAMLTDRLAMGIAREHLRVNYFPVVASIFVMVYSLIILAGNYEPLLARLSFTFSRALHPDNSDMQQNVDFITANTQPGEEVLILSLHSGIYHLYSRTRSPLRIPGPSEWFLVDELNTVYGYLAQGNWSKVFIDSTCHVIQSPWLVWLDSWMMNTYVPVRYSPDGSIRLFLRERSR